MTAEVEVWRDVHYLFHFCQPLRAGANEKWCVSPLLESVAEARASLGRYLIFYNAKRPHSSLGARTPDEAYFNPKPLAKAA